MPLLSCTKCDGKVSSDASICPHCGSPNFSEIAKSANIKQEKINNTLTVVGFFISSVVSYFSYKWIINPLGGALFGISPFWQIFLSIFVFMACFGAVTFGINASSFFENQKK
mgnify:CR=1 FL=1